RFATSPAFVAPTRQHVLRWQIVDDDRTVPMSPKAVALFVGVEEDFFKACSDGLGALSAVRAPDVHVAIDFMTSLRPLVIVVGRLSLGAMLLTEVARDI